MRRFSMFITLCLLILLSPQISQASGCYQDPIYERDELAQVKSAVWVRDGACVQGTNILKTLSANMQVDITGFTDGWYRVKTNDGVTGWVGATFLKIIDKSLKNTTTETKTDSYVATTKTTIKNNDGIYNRLKGYILLQVENNGEAWYVHPTDGKRYYMKDGPTAYNMMRFFGLGITNADLDKLMAGDINLNKRLRGKIVLKVEAHGEAYYIHPKDGTIHYLKDGAAAYKLMRELSLGITNNDLTKLADRDFADVLQEKGIENNTDEGSTGPKEPIVITPTTNTPSNIDLDQLNQYWLTKINGLRAQSGLRLLTLDQRWINTATEWATYMGANNATTHNRPDGKSMHEWIDTKNLDFTTRYSENGWDSNYFTENIAWGYTDNSMTEMYKVLNDTLDFYLSEASYNGPHYRTIYHKDWNSVGAGFYWKPLGDGRYQVYMAFHYGSLNL